MPHDSDAVRHEKRETAAQIEAQIERMVGPVLPGLSVFSPLTGSKT
jgi:hypothetical protein